MCLHFLVLGEGHSGVGEAQGEEKVEYEEAEEDANIEVNAIEYKLEDNNLEYDGDAECNDEHGG